MDVWAQSRSKVPRQLLMVWNIRDGLARTTKTKASPARAEAKASKTKGKGKGKNHNYTARKGRKDLTELRGTTTRKTHKPVKIYTEWTDVTWDQVNNWTDAYDWNTTQDRNKRQDRCHRRNRLKSSPIQRLEEAFQC